MLRIIFNKFTIGLSTLVFIVLRLLTNLEGTGTGPIAQLWWKFTMWLAAHGL